MRTVHFILLYVFWNTCTNGFSDHMLRYYETLKPADIKTRVKRGIDPNPSSHLHQVWFSALGRDFHLVMKQASIFSKGFKMTIADGKGRLKPYTLDQKLFFSGKLHDEEASDVRAHWEDGMLTASITASSDMYVVEPAWRILPPSQNHSIIAYRQSDIRWDPGGKTAGHREKFCEVAEKNSLIKKNVKESATTNSREKRDTGVMNSNVACRMYIVADYRFHVKMGGRKIHRTASYIISLLNRVNAIYHRTRWPDDNSGLTDLGFEIAELRIHENYTYEKKEHYNMPKREFNTTRLLQVFSQGTMFKKYCLAHLFTYQSFQHGVLGLAYIASSRKKIPGGICSDSIPVNGVMSTLNTGWSTSVNSQNEPLLSLEAALVTAHELGHSWGSEHDSGSCSPKQKDGGPYLMYPYSVSGYEVNNKFFSSCSRRYIYEVLKSKGKSCFTTSKSFTFCGNGRVEEGEQCDAGVNGDSCCSTDCKFIGRAVCSPWNYECCSSGCQVEYSGIRCTSFHDEMLSCKLPAYCDGDNKFCPEPQNRNDSRECMDKGRCRDGVCVGYCELKGLVACICPQSSGYACYRCCRKHNETKCEVQSDMDKLPKGRPCYRGYCVNGNCEKQIADVVQRLFNLIDNITADKLVAFMRSNIVGTIIVFSLFIWIPASCLFSYFDKKKERKLRKPALIVRSKSNHTLAEEDKKQVWHYGSLKLKHGGSIIRRQNLATGYPMVNTERESRV